MVENPLERTTRAASREVSDPQQSRAIYKGHSSHTFILGSNRIGFLLELPASRSVQRRKNWKYKT